MRTLTNYNMNVLLTVIRKHQIRSKYQKYEHLVNLVVLFFFFVNNKSKCFVHWAIKISNLGLSYAVCVNTMSGLLSPDTVNYR